MNPPEGSVPVFLWKHTATDGFPGGVGTTCPLPTRSIRPWLLAYISREEEEESDKALISSYTG